MRYRRGFSFGISDTRVKPSFFLTAPARKPRTLCCCQPVAACSSSIVAPSCRPSRSRQVCCFVCLPVAGLVLLRGPTPPFRRVCRFGAFALLLLPFALSRRWRLARSRQSSSHLQCDLSIGWSSILSNRASCAVLPPPKAPPLRRGALGRWHHARPPTTSAWTLSSKEKSSSLCGVRASLLRTPPRR